jgi:hypothetical protein
MVMTLAPPVFLPATLMSNPFDEGRFKTTPTLAFSSSAIMRTIYLWSSCLSNKKGDRSAQDARIKAPCHRRIRIAFWIHDATHQLIHEFWILIPAFKTANEIIETSSVDFVVKILSTSARIVFS